MPPCSSISAGRSRRRQSAPAGPDFVDRVHALADRPTRVLGSLQQLFNTGRLRGTGYVSILPVDQGIEHSAGASFAPNPAYFDPENIVKLAIEGGCNAVASTLGVLGAAARRYAHKIPFIVKVNHNEFISYPNSYDQIRFAQRQAGVRHGRRRRRRDDLFRVARIEAADPGDHRDVPAGARARHVHRALVLSAEPRVQDQGDRLSPRRRSDGQANHLGVTIEADIIKQKLPENEPVGFDALKFGKTHKAVYTQLCSDNPIDLTRYQLANCYMGRAGLINSGGASAGESDLKEAVKTAVINKRAGGTGLISGRKAFQRPMNEGVALLNAIQDVYLTKEVTIACSR